MSSIFTEEYIDEDIQVGDSIDYKIYAKDKRNDGEYFTLTVNVTPIGEETEEPAEEPAEEPVVEPTDELDQLASLLNYYKVRYNIKCMRNGIPALQNDSACLWARIDLVYAQEKLGKSDIDTSITDYDITLMSNRLKYPEQRYQTNCVESETPADYCSALGKAIDRIHYFIEK